MVGRFSRYGFGTKEIPILGTKRQVFLDTLKLNKTQVCWLYDNEESLWGQLDQQPGGILYTHLHFRELGNNRLEYTRLGLQFKDQSREEAEDGVVVTKYGPKHVRGQPQTEKVENETILDPQVEVGALGVNVKAEVGSVRENVQRSRIERWHFDAMPLPGTGKDNNGQVKGIDWAITEARHTADAGHNPQWKLGVALLHDLKKFTISAKIIIRFIWLQGIWEFHSRERIKEKTMVPKRGTENLGSKAEQLPEELLEFNLRPVPTQHQT